MSILEQIRKLDEQKQQLLKSAKAEALKAAESAINDLNSLGFSYRLVGGGGSTGTRRTGIRKEVLDLIRAKQEGMGRADILTALDAHDKSAQQSVSNALSALKKNNNITRINGKYIVTMGA